MRHSPDQNWKIDFAAVRQQIAIADVLNLIDWKPTKTHGSQLRDPCPIHQSTPGSVIFAVNLNRNTWYCHSNKCKKGGNQLDLYAAVKGKMIYLATKELCYALGIDLN